MKIYVLLVCLGTILTVKAQNFGSAAMRKLQMAEFAISNFYVDKVDEDKLVEEAIIKMLAQLDPHSTYSDAEEHFRWKHLRRHGCGFPYSGGT